MNPVKLIAIVLIVAGSLGLVYGGFSYTKDTTAVKLGPIEFNVKEKETVNVPLIVSGAAIVLGVVLLVGHARQVHAHHGEDVLRIAGAVEPVRRRAPERIPDAQEAHRVQENYGVSGIHIELSSGCMRALMSGCGLSVVIPMVADDGLADEDQGQHGKDIGLNDADEQFQNV